MKVKFIWINLILSSSSSFSSLRISNLLLKVSLVCLCSTMSDCRLLITVFNCRRSLSDFSCSPSLCLHLQNKDTIISLKINKVYLTLNKDTILLQMYIVINIFLLISMEKNRTIYPCICTLYVYCTISKISKFFKNFIKF